MILQDSGLRGAFGSVRRVRGVRYAIRDKTTYEEKESGREGRKEGERNERREGDRRNRRAVEQGVRAYRRLPRTGTPEIGIGRTMVGGKRARKSPGRYSVRALVYTTFRVRISYTGDAWCTGIGECRVLGRAFTEQQELDLAGGALAISAEVLVDLLGPLGGLLLAGGAHGAAHPRALAGDGLLSARRRDGNDATTRLTITMPWVPIPLTAPSNVLSSAPIRQHHAHYVSRVAPHRSNDQHCRRLLTLVARTTSCGNRPHAVASPRRSLTRAHTHARTHRRTRERARARALGRTRSCAAAFSRRRVPDAPADGNSGASSRKERKRDEPVRTTTTRRPTGRDRKKRHRRPRDTVPFSASITEHGGAHSHGGTVAQ